MARGIVGVCPSPGIKSSLVERQIIRIGVHKRIFSHMVVMHTIILHLESLHMIINSNHASTSPTMMLHITILHLIHQHVILCSLCSKSTLTNSILFSNILQVIIRVSSKKPDLAGRKHLKQSPLILIPGTSS